MAIPKRGSRKIVVEGTPFRWRVRGKPTHMQSDFGTPMSAAVELYEKPGSVLTITFPWMRCDAYSGLLSEAVLPADIEACIKKALSGGWNPSKQGRGFKLVHVK